MLHAWLIAGTALGLTGLALAALREAGRLSAPAGSGIPQGRVERWIEGRFRGYRQRLVTPDPSLPRSLSPAGSRKVVVIGGGLAGIAAAGTLAGRGYQVELVEAEHYLGGKCGAWTMTAEDGMELPVEHGFHAIFRHYYNLRRILAEAGVEKHYKDIGDYLILRPGGEGWSFKDIARAPVLNLLSMWKTGVYSLAEVMVKGTWRYLLSMLTYRHDRTFEKWDEVSFDEYARRARLPAELKLVFNTFARAFFAEGDRMSMAEVIKSFHFYFLSHDHGLLYDYLDDDYDEALIQPLRRWMESAGCQVRLSSPVTGIARREGPGPRFTVSLGGENPTTLPADHVVMACDVVGVRSILENAPSLKIGWPTAWQRLTALRPSQRYSVLRIWTDTKVERDWPVFVATDRERVLDSITLVHEAEKASARWVEENGGGVYELHCYALPDDIPEDRVEEFFLKELYTWLPELRGAEIRYRALQVNRNFASFHLGQQSDRPTTQSGIPGLVLAGDWVRLPAPAMLMEAAATSGLLAADAIFAEDGLAAEPVDAVPARGILAARSAPPTADRLLPPSESRAERRRIA